MTNEQAIYIGDGVYLEFSGYDFVLKTDRGSDGFHFIHLEPEALQKLAAFARSKGVKL